MSSTPGKGRRSGLSLIWLATAVLAVVPVISACAGIGASDNAALSEIVTDTPFDPLPADIEIVGSERTTFDGFRDRSIISSVAVCGPGLAVRDYFRDLEALPAVESLGAEGRSVAVKAWTRRGVLTGPGESIRLPGLIWLTYQSGCNGDASLATLVFAKTVGK